MYISDHVEADDYYEPDTWADPNIRLAYQASLGAFVVNFNELDDLVTRLVGFAYEVIERPLPRSIPRSFAAKVDLLETFGGMKVLQLQDAPISELRAINAMRNFLVHGHFDQNPFDGSYVVIPVNKAQQADHIQAAVIDAWSARATIAWEKLRVPEAVYYFRDTDMASLTGDQTAKA
jgi:hypothetical protein